MITKGIIKKLSTVDDNHFLVYIPLLRKANSGVEMATLPATLVCIPGIDNYLKVGDVVYISFEDNEKDKPVILGKLYLGQEDKQDIMTTITSRTSETVENAKLPPNTSIESINIVDIYTKLTWLMENNFLPAYVKDDNLCAESEIITYTNASASEEIKTVKDALDYLISRL